MPGVKKSAEIARGEPHVFGSQAEEGKAVDADTQRLEEMGYSQPMKRKYSVMSVLGVAYSLTNSWWGVSASLVTGINSGGSALLVYGTILLALVSTAVAATLSELVSAMPNAAGQSFWARELVPRKYARLASYITGWLAWSGSIFASASVASGVASACVGSYALSHPTLEVKPWHTLVAYQVVNLFCFLFNIYGKTLSLVGNACLWTSLGSFFVILIVVPARAASHTSPNFVFASFSNATGWQSDGIAFIVGLINANWGFSCLDAAVHLAEEIQHPERMVPIAIMGVIAIGFVTSFAFVLSMMFSVQDLAAFLAASFPSLELFQQALRNDAGAIVLEALTIATGMGNVISCHTWAARLCWSFSRDHGVPFARIWSQIAPSVDTPLAAHILNTAIVAAIGCIYLASRTAFNSMVTACIVLPYLSYVLPVIGLLLRGRNSIQHGPFWLGKLGLFANWVCLAWIFFTWVFYSFPAQMPATGGNMNYVCVIYAVIGVIMIIDWFSRARRIYLSNIATIDGQNIYEAEVATESWSE
ncbi:amino acid transporter [Aspergillus homomorphus CBS 101889]|uniref:Amino acid transporter n=1 Tax=Aspergillus homomorphus (strain CBS 101889) TaxID=1450537 RepID=A0A395I3E5_ASPHC|nr:amino acid transporter [Aspergillus homomorphus CBS 101889]RAL14722.1 amino acid transporter [Aspergillus homomorphus CBS 101889]